MSEFSIRERAGSLRTDATELLVQAVVLAALFHDIGKSIAWFQEKLRAALRKSASPIADPVRHELISALVIDALANQGEDDQAVLRLLKTNAATSLKIAHEAALAKIPSLFRCNGKEPLKFQMLAKNSRYPFLADVLRLILTHHRLMAGDRGDILSENHINLNAWRDTSIDAVRLAPYAPLWSDDRWVGAVHDAAEVVDNPTQVPNIYAYGRLGLMLGDHLASRLGSKTSISNGDCLVANTGRRSDSPDGKIRIVLAETLPDHLMSVAYHTRRIMLVLLREQDCFPSIPLDQVPDALLFPDKTGPFSWHGHGSHLTSATSHDRLAGFFGIVLAKTGSGKTRGCPIQLASASGLFLAFHEDGPKSSTKGFRFNLALGLRSLTLQSGSEYVRDVGLLPQHVTVMVGDLVSRVLHDAAQNEANFGVEAEPDDMIGAPADIPEPDELGACQSNLCTADSHDIHDKSLPAEIEEIYPGEEKTLKMLRAPVLVSTTDQLMLAADARRGRHLGAMLRVATADLILDEIDAYSPEDLAAIGRLIYLCGAFGRRVLLASATLSPNISRSFFLAYQTGLMEYRKLIGGQEEDRSHSGVRVGWFSDEETICRVEANVVPESFDIIHSETVRRVVENLDSVRPQRSGMIVRPGDPGCPTPVTIGNALSAMARTSRIFHEKWNFDIEGIKTSIGMIRCSTVRNCRRMVEHIKESGVDDALVGIACYHSRLLGVVRYRVERALDTLLKRKSGSDGNDGIRQHPVMRKLVQEAKSRGLKNVIMVVVTTPIEETGRDHDFDWAILEPCSTRSLIQCAGRVFRHRPWLWADYANIAMLDRPLRAYQTPGLLSGAFSWPGVETPLTGIKDIANRKLSSVDFDEVYDVTGFCERIDARHSLVVPDRSLCELAAVEHGLVDDFLLDHRRWRSLEWYISGGPDRRFLSEHADTRIFRRSQHEKKFFLQWDFEEAEAGRWKEIQWDKASRQDRVVDPPTGLIGSLCDDTIFHPDVIWAISVDMREVLGALRGYFPVMTDLEYSCNLLGFSIYEKIGGALEGSIMTGMDWIRSED